MFPRSWRFGPYLLLFTLLTACAPAALAPTADTPPDKTAKVDWPHIIESRLPPLRHDRGDRWPLVLWQDGDQSPRTANTVRAYLDRGIVPHIKLDTAWIPAARILQAAGAPVIAIEGKSGAWPYLLAGEADAWANRYPDDAEVPETWKETPSPPLIAGWAVAAGRLRDTLRAFQAAGLTLDGAWLDYEVQPRHADYEAAVASPRTKALLPRAAAADPGVFRYYRWQLWTNLLSAYVAGPIREAFPKAAVTNWMAVVSTPENRVPWWGDLSIAPTLPGLFTHTNPVAYGIDLHFRLARDTDFPRDRDHVDRFYTHLLLRQVSIDAENRRNAAPYLGSLPWVARWVQILDEDEKTREKLGPVPMMSRPAYREALRHLWLRGIDGMQVFNSATTSSPEIAIEEVEDAQAVYDEMLAYRDFLDDGEILTYAVPGPQEAGAVWSGLRLGDRALIRLGRQGPFDARVELEPWPGSRATLWARSEGETLLLTRDPRTGSVAVDRPDKANGV